MSKLEELLEDTSSSVPQQSAAIDSILERSEIIEREITTLTQKLTEQNTESAVRPGAMVLINLVDFLDNHQFKGQQVFEGIKAKVIDLIYIL